jgi:hypothetical protein
MKKIEALAIILIAALAVTIYFDYSLYNSNQKLTSDFIALNGSYNDLNNSYNILNTQYYNSLSSLFNAINSGANTTVQPPISELQALQMALQYGGWNATSLQGNQVSISLWYVLLSQDSASAGPGFDMIQEVTAPVSNYSATTFVYASWPANYTGPTWSPVHPPITLSYHYAWVVVVEQASGMLSIPPPGFYVIDAATGEVIPMGPLA